MTDWILIAIGLVLTVGTAIFVAAEFSIVALDPAHVDDSNRRGRRVRRALATLSTQLSGAQVGITITTIGLGYTAQPAVAAMLQVPLEDTALSRTAVGLVAGAVSLVIVNVVSMIFGELVPKNLALSTPHATARATVGFNMAFTSALGFMIRSLNATANRILRLMGIEPREELPGGRSAQELAALVRRSAEAGTLDARTALLLKNTLELDDLTAIDVMTDRTRMHVLTPTDSAADVIRRVRETGHSRFPVIGASHDDVAGLVHVRSAMQVPYAQRETVFVSTLMVDVEEVPETLEMRPLLAVLKSAPHQFALVVDEYGGTAGVVTFEDVVEELVGDVSDEHDRRRAGVYRRVNGAWSIPASMRPDELTEATGVHVPEEAAYETVGGYVMARLGRIAQPGDTLTADGVIVEVEAMSGRRIERVRIESAPAQGSRA